MSYEEVIFIFFKEMEHIYAVSDSPLTFQSKLDSASTILYSRMRSFDHGINVELIWNGAEDWKEFRLNGVKISWSEKYLKENPELTNEMYIDVINLLLKD